MNPINIHYAPRNPIMEKVMIDNVDEMIKAKVIDPSHACWIIQIWNPRHFSGLLKKCYDLN